MKRVWDLPAFLPAGLLAHSDLDERAIEALKEFNEEGALQVLLQFKESDLSHVQVSTLAVLCVSDHVKWGFIDTLSLSLIQNKSAFLCGVMKTYRQREKQGSKVLDSSKGPDEAKIKVSPVMGFWCP